MSDSVEDTALSMGWKPLDKFAGDPAKWVDAKTFVDRGEHFLPLVKADRDKLRSQVDGLSAELQETKRLFQASQEAIEELKKFQDENTRRQVEVAKANWVKQLKDARSNDDVEGELAAQAEINKLDRALEAKPVAAPPPPAAAPAPAAADPVFTAWAAENSWFSTDKRKTALAMAVAQEFRTPGHPNAQLQGRAFFDKITEEVNAVFEPATRSVSKVAGGRPSGQGGGATRTYTYADLPEEAKSACDSFARKLAGPGRAYKTVEDWQAHYTKQYFSGENA